MKLDNRYRRQSNRSGSNQQGAALIVAMVLIFLLSVLGLTSMRSSTLETRLVGNALEKDLTFQAADSASEISLDDEDALIAIACTDNPLETTVTEMSNNVVDATASLSYAGQSPAIGFSLDSNVSNFRFTSTGTATLVESGTSTSVTQGVLILGARSAQGSC